MHRTTLDSALALLFACPVTASLKLWMGAVCISFAPVFVKLAGDMGPTLLGFYRCLFGAAFLLFIVPPNASYFKKLKADGYHIFKLLILAGIALALDLFVWHRSVLYAGAGLSTILGNTQVFYLAAFGILFMGEKPSVRLLISVLLAFGGIALLVSPNPTHSMPSIHRWGVGFGLATGVVYAAYVGLLRVIEQKYQAVVTNLGVVCLISAVCLFVITAIEGNVHAPQGMEWLWVIALAVTAQLLGWLLITPNLPKVPISRAGLILLTQPVGAALWGALFFNERLTLSQLFGAACTLVAIYLGTLQHRRRPRSNP